jgi:hypothetical protein
LLFNTRRLAALDVLQCSVGLSTPQPATQHLPAALYAYLVLIETFRRQYLLMPT